MPEQNAVPEVARIQPTILWSSVILLPLAALLLITPYNHSLFFIINHHLAINESAGAWAILTNLGDGFFLFPLAMVLFLRKPDQQLALIISMIVLALTINIAKELIGAPRPALVLGSQQLSVIGPVLKHGSFPSGHVGTAFLLAGLACVYLRLRLMTLVLLLMTLSGLSRVVVGAHWPADVIAGAWVGIVCAAIGSWISRKFSAGLVTRLLFILLGLVAVGVLPWYRNGFSLFPEITIMEYVLALLAGVAVISEVTALCSDNKERLGCFFSSVLTQMKVLIRGQFRKFLRFGMVGASGFVVDISIYTLLASVAGVPHLVARGCSYWCSASWNWIWNRTFTFGDAEKTRKFPQWGKYLVMCLISFMPNWGTYYLLTTYIPFFMDCHQLALVAGVGTGMLFNFAMASLVIFGQPAQGQSRMQGASHES